jgi:hypothetical protein
VIGKQPSLEGDTQTKLAEDKEALMKDIRALFFNQHTASMHVYFIAIDEDETYVPRDSCFFWLWPTHWLCVWEAVQVRFNNRCKGSEYTNAFRCCSCDPLLPFECCVALPIAAACAAVINLVCLPMTPVKVFNRQVCCTRRTKYQNWENGQEYVIKIMRDTPNTSGVTVSGGYDIWTRSIYSQQRVFLTGAERFNVQRTVALNDFMVGPTCYNPMYPCCDMMEPFDFKAPAQKVFDDLAEGFVEGGITFGHSQSVPNSTETAKTFADVNFLTSISGSYRDSVEDMGGCFFCCY